MDSSINQQDQKQIRQYLLGQLSGEDESWVELRLLSDRDYVEEFDMISRELIDQYVNYDLSSEDRKLMESHFLQSEERRDQLKFAFALQARAQERAAERNRKNPVYKTVLAIAASIVVALGLGFLIWRTAFHQSEIEKGLVALNAAYQLQRPVEARISRLNYAPLSNTRDSGQDRIDYISLNRAERILLDEVGERPTPAAQHALGRLYLTEQKFDTAIAQFEEALKVETSNPSLYSDLGAALLEKGKAEALNGNRGEDFGLLAKSLEALNKALELNASLLEARFNRALVYKRMLLLQQAEEDWRKYLEKDSNSKWADEVRQNLALLEQQKQKVSRTKDQLLAQFLGAHESGDDERAWDALKRSREALSRKLIWEQLLDQYVADAIAGRTEEAQRVLKALTYEGDLEHRIAADEFVAGLATFYRSAARKELQTLERARSLMKQGHEYYFAHKMDRAQLSYEAARELFSGLGNTCESDYARHWIGYSFYEQGKTQQSLLILGELERALEKNKYQWLRMRTLHLMSSGYHNLNEYSKAIRYNRQALSLAEQIDDVIGIFNACSILTFQLSSTGNHSDAFRYASRSLSAMPECPLNQIQTARQYTIIALALDAAGLYRAAIDYQNEALRSALALGHVQHISLDYARLGLMYAKLDNFDEALKDLNLAFGAANSHPDEIPRKEMQAFASLQTGHLFRQQGDFNKAITNYDQTIALSDHFHFKYDVYEAHKNRLSCYIALGNDRAAEEELATTLSIAEKYRSTITEDENRNSFFDIQQSVYDLAVDFAYSRLNDSKKAFQYSEDSRARSLLDSVAGPSHHSREAGSSGTSPSVVHPLSLQDIQARMPVNAQILQYAVLNDKLLIWVLSTNSFSTVESTIRQNKLKQEVTEYVRLLRNEARTTSTPSTDTELRKFSIDLYDSLIRPAEHLLDKQKPVYLIPDKFLGFVPFSTLTSRTTNRLLLEDYQLQLSPSSSLFVIVSELARTKEGIRNETLLSVGNPSFDRLDYPSLADLPSAATEAEQIATYYKKKHVLIGKKPTRERVREEMPSSDVIHLALHAVVDERSPLRSRLVLAKDGTDGNDLFTSEGSLQAFEIYQMKLQRTRLAVLSACQTGAERYYDGEGMLSLARPFLTAEVPLVVATLWPVDSTSTAELMINFHKHRTQTNVSSAEALRLAQLEMLRNSERFRDAYFWGGFVLIGGSTNF